MTTMGTVYDLERNRALGIDTDSLLAKNKRLRETLDSIGAMVYMDRHGNIKFKPDFGPEDMLNEVNAALKE